MKLRSLTAISKVSGRTAKGIFTLLAVSFLLSAGSLPQVDLVDSAGAKVGRADLKVTGDKCQVHLTVGKMPPGRYRPVLAKGTQCFGSGAGHQTISEAAYFVVDSTGATTAEFVFSSANESGSLEEIIAHSGLIFQAMPDPSPDKPRPAAACGQVSRWFSPWRDFRRPSKY
jgi:hypothetical protein